MKKNIKKSKIGEEKNASEEESGRSGENKKTNIPAALGMLGILLVVAILANMLPQLFMKTGNTTGETGALISEETRIADSTAEISLINASSIPQKPACNQTLLSGNERDSYTYAVRYDSAELSNQTSVMRSSFNRTSEGFVRDVVTTMETGRLELVFYFDDEMKCEKVIMNITLGDQTESQEVECTPGNDRIEICAEEVYLLNAEKITAEAGTFDTNVYSALDNSTKFWIGDASVVSVPIRIISQNVTMELVNYKIWKNE